MLVEIEGTDEKNNNEIIEKQISPKDRLTFANKIMLGLFLAFIIIVAFIAYSKDMYSKHVFNASMQLINTFGSFIMGFYFSRK